MIDEEGVQLGVMHPLAALDLARQRGLDLVEVAPTAVPPVCRLMDYGRFRYEQTKRERESRRTQRTVTIKEIRLQPKIAEHDMQTKSANARKFLEEGDKVKLTVRLRGREMVHPEVGEEVLRRVIGELGAGVIVEQTPKLEGRSMTAVVAPPKDSGRQKKQASESAESGAGKDGSESAKA